MSEIEQDLLEQGKVSDLAILNYDLALTQDGQITAQKVKQALTTFKGEWFLDESEGMPYIQEIFGKNPDLNRIKSLYIRAIQSVAEVTEILELDLTEDKQSRTLSVDMKLRDLGGNIVEVSL